MCRKFRKRVKGNRTEATTGRVGRPRTGSAKWLEVGRTVGNGEKELEEHRRDDLCIVDSVSHSDREPNTELRTMKRKENSCKIKVPAATA